MDFIKYTETSLRRYENKQTKAAAVKYQSYQHIHFNVILVSIFIANTKYNANTNIQSQTLSSFISSKA